MAKNEPRLSHRTLQIIAAFMERPEEGIAGSEIARRTGMLSGTLYPNLMRLEKSGWLSSEWEKLDPKEAGRPRKRFYRLTPLGRRKAYSALDELRVPNWRPAWNF